ncbi:MAG: chromosome segregation protein SMC [Bacillota bacterium]|jgi:chromosome segregation protein
MHLVRLELYGFKSFSNKTEFTFSPGITALVGPNGCGKSNVVDAIRWVLGEQNPRILRANKMTDLIYAGSEKSDQKNFAEVSVVLDNSDNEIPLDFREVTITRRYYRSGESEYFLNRVPCRLKDINEVLASTSLGRGTYSIIGQGQVAEIINSRPEDRRVVFEEAAGIALYKMRKSEALKKLGDTQGNLTRIDDIIHELMGQEEDIRESAARANVFVELKSEGDKVELALWAARYADLQRRLGELEERRESLLASKLAGEVAGKELESQLAEATAALEECSGIIAALEGNRTQLAADQTQLEYKLELYRQRQNDYANMIAGSGQRLNSLKAQLEKYQEEFGSCEAELENSRNGVTLYTVAQGRRGAAASLVRRLLASAEHYCGKADALILQTTKASTEYASSKEKALEIEAQLAGQLASVQQDMARWQGDLREIRNEIQAYAGEQEELKEKAAALAEEETELQNELAAASAAIAAARREHSEAEKELHTVQQKITMFQAMEEEMQDYGQGTKAALRAREQGHLRGIYGAVGELIKVKNPQHSLAIETALGGALQYVVCDTDAACRQAIDFLKRNNAGRATFVPVTAGRKPIRQVEGSFSVPVLGWANELVQCPPEVEPVIAMLLGNVLVMENLDLASRLAIASNYRYKIVTLEGEVISRGLYTGGSFGRQAQGPLQRRAALAAMKKLLADKGQVIAEKEQLISLAKAKFVQLEEKIQGIAGQQKELERELIRLGAQLEQAELREGQLAEEESNCQQRLVQLEQRLQAVREQLQGISAMLDKDKAGLDKLRDCKDRFNAYEAELKDMVSLWSSRQNSLQLAVYSWQNHRENLERQRKALELQKSATEGEIASLTAEIAAREEQQRQMQANIAQAHQALAEIAAGLEEVSASLDVQASNRNKAKGDITSATRALDSLREEMEQVQASLHDLDLKKARWQAETEGMAAQLLSQFGLNPDKGLEYLDNRFTLHQLAAKARNIQEQISQLGEVNLAAIQQHKKLTERLSFLEGQRSDLAHAVQDIMDLVAELDEKIRTLFMETFAEVQEHFSRIFKILFEGGSAYLTLNDEENPLETGIEIFARPTGKRTQALSLLSGGEKALTAIALLFALQSVRPAPFCILDEIEAALDDTNILRFSKYLRQLAQDRQFILITHRRETMEHSDSLYGITLNKEGSSQPISVILNEERQRTEQL